MLPKIPSLARRGVTPDIAPRRRSGDLIALGQAQHEVADDVALNLRRARLDGVAARAQIPVRPLALVDHAGRSVRQLPIRPENLHRNLLEALIQLAPYDLLDRAFRPRHTRFVDAGERPQLIQPHHFDLGVALRQFLPDQRILRGGFSIAVDFFCNFDEAVKVAAVIHLQRRAERAAFVHQRAHGNRPALIHLAQQIRYWHAHVTKENFAEFALAAHLLQAANLYAGGVHVDTQRGKPLVLWSGRIRADHQFAPVGGPGVAGPDLLSIHDKMVTVAHRRGAERRQVAARVRLRKALAPDLFGREQFRQIAFLLLRRAEGDDCRSDQAERDDVGHGRRLGAGHFLDENDLLHYGSAASAEVLGPGDARPSGVVERALPGAQILEAAGHRILFVPPLYPVLRDVGGEPCARFIAEPQLLRRQIQIHGDPPL